MQLSQKEIRESLWTEFMIRSRSAATAYAVISLALAFFPLVSTQNAWLVRLLALLSFSSAIARGLSSAYGKRLKKGSKPWYRAVHISAVGAFVNVALWAALFWIFTLDTGYLSEISVIRFALVSGISAGAISSLASFVMAQVVTCVAYLGPQIAFGLWVYWNQPTNFHPLVMAFLACVLLVYCIQQGVIFHRYTLRSIYTQIELSLRVQEVMANREAMLQQAARTQHASRLASLGEMASGVAHEINNPLAIVKANLEVVQMALHEERGHLSDAKILLERVEHAQKSVARIVKIVAGMRRLSRQSDLEEYKPVPVSEIVRDTLEFCQERMRSAGVRFDFVTDLSEEIFIHCRAVQISQILINLLNNAHDAVVGNSDAKNRWVRLSVTRIESECLFAVENGGPLIPDAVSEKIFQPFFTTKPAGKGTGLGLSISNEIASEHQGELSLDRESLVTRFVLKIPQYVESNALQGVAAA